VAWILPPKAVKDRARSAPIVAGETGCKAPGLENPIDAFVCWIMQKAGRSPGEQPAFLQICNLELTAEDAFASDPANLQA
jgi:hypothetical protein